MADKDRGKKDDGKKPRGGKGNPDEQEQDFLEDFERLNRNPPHVGPLKKAPSGGGEKRKER
jgi:hypothetical protein